MSRSGKGKTTRTERGMVGQWEASIIELTDDRRKRFKVTRRLPDIAVAETRFFNSKRKALEQLKEWLR